MKHIMPRRVALAAIAVLLVGAVVWWSAAEPRIAAPSARAPAAPRAALSGAPDSPLDLPSLSRPALGRSSKPDFDQPPPADPQERLCNADRHARYLARLRQMPTDSPGAAIEHALLRNFTVLLSNDPLGLAAGADSEYQTARLRWPDDLDVAWISMAHCSQSDRCEPHAEWRHLVSLDPDNAAVWLIAAGQALQDNDQVGFELALHRAATARLYDPHTGLVYRHARWLFDTLPMPRSCVSPDALQAMQAMLGRPPVAGDWADLSAVGVEMAEGIPSYGALRGCRADRHPLSPALRRDCDAVLSLLADGDTLSEQSIGLGLAIRNAGGGSASAQLRERFRQLAWLKLQAAPPFPATYLHDVWTNGEVVTIQALAIARGRWPPPPDWLPDDIDSRTLILTGHAAPVDERL